MMQKGPAVHAYDVEFARWLLVNHGDIGVEALSSLLFLLDALSFLRDCGDRRTVGEQEAEGEGQRWSDWLAYIREVYCAASIPNSPSLSGRCPLALPYSICEPLQLWLASNTNLTAIFPGKELEAVANACRAAIAFFHAHREDLQEYTVSRRLPESSIEEQYRTLLLDSADAPLPLDWGMLEMIRTSLLQARQKSSKGADKVAVFRWTLSAILEQHFGSSNFGQKQDSLGRLLYATKAADDTALREFFRPDSETGSIADMEESAPDYDLVHSSSTRPTWRESGAIPRGDADVKVGLSRSRKASQHRVTASEPINALPAGVFAVAPYRRYSTNVFEDASNTSLPTELSAYSSNSSAAPLWPHSRIDAFPASPDLDEADRPFSDCIVVKRELPPPTSNSLSSGQRRDLVRRSRKLQSMLGATLDEAAAQKALVGVLQHNPAEPDSPEHSSGSSSPLRRRKSDPLPSPTDGRRGSVATLRQRPRAAPPADFTSSPETPYTRSDSDDDEMGSTTDFTSPEMDLKTPNDYETQIPWGKAFIQSLEADAKARDERRRRVAKLQRVLGERVPAELIFAPPPLPVGRPKKLPGRFENAFSRLTLRSKSMARTPTDDSSGLSSDEFDVPNRVSQSADVVARPRSAVVAPNLTPEQTLASIRKARKLEKLFGQLPPSNLYERPRFVRAASSYDSDDEGDTSSQLHKRRSSTSSRRASVNALLHLHYNDPAQLEDVVQSLAEDQRPIQLGLPGLASPSSPDSFAGRATIETQRHFARASKLARIFGTTRGEVLKRVLEDLEADLEEDDPVSEDEREEVLAGIRRLRAELVIG